MSEPLRITGCIFADVSPQYVQTHVGPCAPKITITWCGCAQVCFLSACASLSERQRDQRDGKDGGGFDGGSKPKPQDIFDL